MTGDISPRVDGMDGVLGVAGEDGGIGEDGGTHCKKWKMGDGHLSSYFWIFIQLFLDICPADFCPAISGLMS